MFTGIIEAIGTVGGVEPLDEGRRLRLAVTGWAPLPVGASVAVNGVCLTTVSGGDEIVVDVVPETLSRSNLGLLSVGSPVNLERAMPAHGRFDGHIVQGHVDGTGRIGDVLRDDQGVRMNVEAPTFLSRYIVEKGSITIDGVSLTVASLEETGFGVALIPHTLEVTTLGLRTRGDLVNLEVDVLSKYVERLLEVRK